MLYYKNCSDVLLEDVVKAFNAGFQDYIIKLEMTLDLLKSRFLFVEDNNLKFSFIAYDDNEPIGLILGGIETFEGIKSLRCGALCIHPNYRGLGVAQKLFELHKEVGIKAGVNRLILEVIKGNDRAISFYLKQGYKIWTELMYYSLSNPMDLDVVKKDAFEIKSIDLDTIESIHKNEVKKHLHWQNSFDYIRRLNVSQNIGLYHDGTIIGVTSYVLNGKLFYLWINPKFDNLNLEKLLLKTIAIEHQLQKVSIAFPSDESFIKKLESIGFTKDSIGQFEMDFWF